jgi:hypothetical protein
MRLNKPENLLKQFKNLLVIDPQEDCDCPVEKYDGQVNINYIFPKDGIPNMVKFDRNSILPIPMSSEPIDYQQFKNCLLASLPYANMIDKVNVYEYSSLLISNKFKGENLSKEWQDTLVDYFIRNNDYNNIVITLSEIPENYIYFMPEPEFFGCFTWNISKYGMFIMANKIGLHVI